MDTMKNMKCWKITDETKAFSKSVIRVGANTFALQKATEEEIAKGNICQSKWYVERGYDFMVCGGPNSQPPHWEKDSEPQSISFEELIFLDGECIGVCHKDCIMLFGDKQTHRQKKYLEEIPLGPESSHEVYDHYHLMRTFLMPKSQSDIEKNVEEAQKAFEKAYVLYNAKNYEESIAWYEKATELGHSDATNNLGCCYLDGKGVEADSDMAAALFRKAMAQGNAMAAGNLRLMNACYGYYLKEDELFCVTKMSAEAGQLHAFVPLAYSYYYGKGCRKNEKLAAYWACRSYAHRDELPEAYQVMARFYKEGYFFPKVLSMAKYCYLKATEMGVDCSQKLKAPDFKTPEPIEPIIPVFDDKAPDFFTQECPHAQYWEALYCLGHRDGKVSANVKKAEELLTKAANQGYTKAQYSLGIRYMDSLNQAQNGGFSADRQLGLRLICKAADHGDYHAIKAMAKLYSDGVGITKEEHEHYADWKEKIFGGSDPSKDVAATVADARMLEILKEIAQRIGTDSFYDGDKVCAMFLDLAPENRIERLRVEEAYRRNAVAILIGETDKSLAVSEAIKRMVDFGWRKPVATETVLAISEALKS